MSVAKSDRKEGELKALTEAQSLFNYTYHITRNNFNKNEDTNEQQADHKWLCDEIRRMCLYIVLDIRTANKKKLNVPEEYEERIAIQTRVEIMYERLSAMVQIAYEQSLIKAKRIKSWDKKIENALILLRNWRKSDRERVKQGISK